MSINKVIKIKPIADFLVVCIELKLRLMKLNMVFPEGYTLNVYGDLA